MDVVENILPFTAYLMTHAWMLLFNPRVCLLRL